MPPTNRSVPLFASVLVLTGVAAMTTGAVTFLRAPPRPYVRQAPPLSPAAAMRLGPLAYRLPLFASEDPDTAIAFYFEKSQIDPGGLTRALLAAAYLAKARGSGNAHWYLLAEQAAHQSLETLPFDNERAVLVLARVSEARHDFRSAVDYADQILARNPMQPEALSVRYAVALARGRLQEALRAATVLIERVPSTGTYAQRAAVYLAQGRIERATADLKRGLVLEEAGDLEWSARLRVLSGRLALRRGQVDLAGSLQREALRIKPGFPPALFARAEILEATGHPAEAAAELLASDGRSSSPALRVAAARLLTRAGAPGAAALTASTEAEVRRDLAAGGSGHRRDLAALLCERRTPAALAEATTLMDEELKLRRDPLTLELAARLRLITGQHEAAEKYISEALAPPPDAENEAIHRDPVVLVTGARIARALGRNDLAKARYAEALAAGAPFADMPEARAAVER